ncbi:hypothetical protein ACFSUK_28740 [Sphingobium scionense]|uniref:Uncharacterized protein n=1 Tax=Sphingobium scionense TaxID=1404341 RepID=A0A7W6LRJ0_9SPHN|nr:hypothetical protein [Sphingobium scionense]MBB4148001.1 hypothetical protein [Sphingobium scionense]
MAHAHISVHPAFANPFNPSAWLSTWEAAGGRASIEDGAVTLRHAPAQPWAQSVEQKGLRSYLLLSQSEQALAEYMMGRA